MILMRKHKQYDEICYVFNLVQTPPPNKPSPLKQPFIQAVIVVQHIVHLCTYSPQKNLLSISNTWIVEVLLNIHYFMLQRKNKSVPNAVGSGSDRGSTHSTSSLPAAYGRLDPLPTSPLHHEGIMRTPPLPPMKKFVK